ARCNRSRPRFLCVPLQRIEPPTALLECVVAGLVDGRGALEDTRVEQNLGFGANDFVVLFDRLEARNGPRVKDGAVSATREISEKEIQRRKQQDVIGKIFVQRKPVIAPLVEIGKGTDINRGNGRKGVIDHHARPVSYRAASYRIWPAYWKS